MTEQSLHNQLKEWYSREDDQLEVNIGDYIIDIVRGELFIEIQTGNFSGIKPKLCKLLEKNRVRLIHPVPHKKWIIRLDKNGKQVSKRKSPKTGRIEEVFYELVYTPRYLMDPNAELEVALVNVEEYLINDGRGSWRRRRWSIHDRKLLNVYNKTLFRAPHELLNLLPDSIPHPFTSWELSRKTGITKRLAQKMVYCLHKMGVIERVGKKKRAFLYSVKS